MTAEEKVRMLVQCQGGRIFFGENNTINVRWPDNDAWTEIGRGLWIGGSRLKANHWEEALQGLIDGRKDQAVYYNRGISLAEC